MDTRIKKTVKIFFKLSPREQKILEMRWGIGYKKPMTLEETGKAFDVTRERIRQLEAKAMEKLSMYMKDGPDQLGSPLIDEYSEEELIKIIECPGKHEFYQTGPLFGALKYCEDCGFGYKI